MTFDIQKAIELDEVNRKKVNLDDLSRYRYQPKLDGCHVLITFGPSLSAPLVRSSTLKPVQSIIPGIINRLRKQYESERIVEGFVTYCGEAWVPGKSFEEISGTFRRHETGYLEVHLFDCVFHAEQDDLTDHTPYEERYARIGGFEHFSDGVHRVPMYAPHSLEAASDHAKLLKSSSYGQYDGAVLVHLDKGYRPGRCRDGEKIKVKPRLELDLRVVRFTPAKGTKTGKQTGAITVLFRGNEVNVAVLSEDYLSELHANPNAWTDRIVAVEAMGVTTGGSLREPTLKGLRDDKDVPDA